MKTHKLFWGILIIGAGILLMLTAFGLGDEYDVFRILGSIFLFGIAVASVVKLNFVLFFMPLALIAYLWRIPLGITDLNLVLLLAAAALLGIGLSLIFRRKSQQVYGKKQGEYVKIEEIQNDNEYVNIDSNLGEYIKHIHAANLKKVTINSSFSSTKVYFEQCQVSSEGLEIAVNCSFSELVINVPLSWTIDNQVSTFAGAVTEVPRNAVVSQTNVKLIGKVTFAELKIQYI